MATISDLPIDIILIIVSFLSAKEAASKAILSKKWQNLFTTNLITIELNLEFDQSDDKNEETFQNFVDRLSARHVSHRIRKFSLKLQSLDKSQFKLVNDCLCNVLKRGIMDLEVDIDVKEGDEYLLPDEVFTSKTIEKLKLGSGFAIYMIPKDGLLPTLKTLLLDTVRFDNLGSDCVFQRLLSACPMIDELVIDGFHWEQWKWSRSVSSQRLKRLILRRNETEYLDFSKSDTMSFDTPNLTHLEYEDILLYEYPVVNLNSIVEAKLIFYVRDPLNEYNVMNLIKGLKNVEILRLNAIDAMGMLFYDFSEEVPVYEKLIHMSVATEAPDYCWNGLRVLLERSPKLETLTIEGYLHYCYFDETKWESVCECLGDYSFLLTCPIKVLKITEFRGDIGEMVQLKHFVEKLLHLEVLELHVEARDDEKVEIINGLMKIPRVSRINCVGSVVRIGLRSLLG